MLGCRGDQEDRAMSQAYDEDVLEWSEHQTALLRRLASGDHANETPDWENIIEEVESVGRSQLSAVRSLLVQALLDDLKCQAWPSSRDVPHWRAEARGFRGDAAEAFTPSMRRRIDMNDLYRRALSRLPESLDDQAPLPVPEACSVTLDDMLSQTR
jgi:hypothetical protein